MWPWKRKKKKKNKYQELNLVVADNKRQVEFSLSKGVPIILCTINGKGAKLLIDSGASLNVLEKSYSKKLGFTVWKQRNPSQISGIGGSSNMLGVAKVDLVINKQKAHIPFKAISFSGVHRKLGIVGVIGSKFLKDHNAIIDYEKRLLTWED